MIPQVDSELNTVSMHSRQSAAASAGAMTVLLSATSYPSDADDWKGVFIRRMLDGLSRRPALTLQAWCPPGPRPEAVMEALRGDDGAWLARLSARGGIAHLLRTRPLQGGLSGIGLVRRLNAAMRASSADLFHVNWLQNALALPADGRPALVTALGTDMQLLKLPLVTRLLRRRFAGRAVVLCPNAEWMVAPLQAAFGDIARVQCVPFGIDGAWYAAPRQPQAAARWLCVTRLTAGKLGPLFEWAEPLFAGQQRQLHLIGPRQDARINVPEWVQFHGPATPEQLSAHWFPACTGLISLSSHPEGRPQVMLEAMAAGVPILASRLPAHVDLIEHGKTGWICDDRDGLFHGIAQIEDHVTGHAMGQNARVAALARFGTWEDCADRYAAQYAALMRQGH